MKQLFARHKVFLALVLACFVRLGVFNWGNTHVVLPRCSQAWAGGDPARFLWQADALLEGKGFLNCVGNEPCTELPPGYPIFVALVFSLSRTPVALLVAQFTISVASCWLVYLAIRPRDPHLAFLGMLGMAGSPWLAAYSSLIMSETLGVFLMSTLALGIARSETRGLSAIESFLVGLNCVALTLTSPATAPLCAFALLILAWRSRSNASSLLALILGAAVPMGIWQVHCYRSIGRFVPTILTPVRQRSEGAVHWIQSWALRGSDFSNGCWVFAWPNDNPDFSIIPHYAYRSESERFRIETLRKTNGSAKNGDALDKLLEDIARERAAQTPIRVWIARIALRSMHLWLDMPDVGLASARHIRRIHPGSVLDDYREAGLKRAVLRFGRGALSVGAYMLHMCYLVCFACLIQRSIRSANAAATAIFAGTLAYTLISSYMGANDLRRNLPFVPALLFLMYYGKPVGWHALRLLRNAWIRRPFTHAERGTP